MTRCEWWRALAVVLVVHTVSAYNNGAIGGEKPVMGWSTWCTDDLCGFTDNCNADEIMQVADAMVEQGMTDLGWSHITLDDCWAAFSRDSAGNLQPLASEFPDGMRALVEYVHARNLTIGLYTDIGTHTCRRGRPGSYGHYEQDATQFASWGVDAVKCDYCNVPNNTDPWQLYGAFSAALNATGRPMMFSICNWGELNPELHAPPIAQAYRIGTDHLPFWSITVPNYPGAGYGQGTKEIIEWMAHLKPSRYQQPWAWMNPDVVETLFPTLSEEESRTGISMWSMWSAPLQVATDVRMMDSRMRALLMNPEVIAIDQDPLAVAADRVRNNTDGTQVWARPLAGGDVGVACLNAGDVLPRRCTVSWTDIGLEPTQKALVRDLWSRVDRGVYAGAFSAIVEAHDTLLLRLSPSSP